MILTQESILAKIAEGSLKFEPALTVDQIGQASVDLRLGMHFRIFKKISQPIPIIEASHYHDFTEEVESATLVVQSLETVLGVTKEKVTIPPDLCGWLEGRSRFARLGLLIHISAGFIQPGVSNNQVLEITNLSPNPIELHANEKICQLIFQKCDGNVAYDGIFKDQYKP